MQLRTVDRFAPPRTAANYDQHLRALSSPVSAGERGIVAIAQGITVLAQRTWDESDGGTDYVLGDALGDMLNGFLAMLNGDLGRLDGGALDSWARYTAAAVGYDLDREQMAETSDEVDAIRDREGLPQSWETAR